MRGSLKVSNWCRSSRASGCALGARDALAREEIRPTGKLTPTPEQKELSFADSFVTMAFDYGLQHYGAARFAFASGFSQVAPTLLHHAVEMFLQVPGCRSSG
jgi:hypothetical protein